MAVVVCVHTPLAPKSITPSAPGAASVAIAVSPSVVRAAAASASSIRLRPKSVIVFAAICPVLLRARNWLAASATAVGTAVPLVMFATMVFAAWVASFDNAIAALAEMLLLSSRADSTPVPAESTCRTV